LKYPIPVKFKGLLGNERKLLEKKGKSGEILSLALDDNNDDAMYFYFLFFLGRTNFL
jgi:hypothetical protein